MPRLFLAIAAGLALADASIVTLGLPSILIELETSVEGVALVLGVYTAALAAALPAGVVVARRAGAPRLGAAGMALFAIASLACGTVDSVAGLVVLRAVQAIGGAAALVAAFILLDGGAPGRGRRLWVAASVFGIAVGPALGGALTEAFDWRAIFLAQAPIVVPGMLVCVSAARRPPNPGGQDRPGGSSQAGPAGAADRGGPLRFPLRPAVALALLSAALTAVIFLVVLLLVAGWSIVPLAAALAVTVLPAAALAGSRLPGEAETRAAAGCVLVGAGIACLALLPGASPWWTVAPQLLAGLGMGMALPALAGELIPERTARDGAGLLSIRHIGIALGLALLAPIVSASLDSAVADAREQGTAVLLDARLPPETKIELAPELFADVDTEDPRGELERSVAEARSGLEGEELSELDRLADRLDRIVTDGVRASFRIAFIVTAGLALIAAMVLVAGALAPVRRVAWPAVGAAAMAGVAAAAVYGVAFASSERETAELADPCEERELPGTGGIGGAFQDVTLAALDRAACEFGSSREELLLALFDEELAEEFEEEYGENPRSLTELGPALLGL